MNLRLTVSVGADVRASRYAEKCLLVDMLYHDHAQCAILHYCRLPPLLCLYTTQKDMGLYTTRKMPTAFDQQHKHRFVVTQPRIGFSHSVSSTTCHLAPPPVNEQKDRCRRLVCHRCPVSLCFPVSLNVEADICVKCHHLRCNSCKKYGAIRKVG